MSCKIMESSTSSYYSSRYTDEFLSKKITVEFIIAKESEHSLQQTRQQYLMGLWELVLKNHRYLKMLRDKRIGLCSAMEATLDSAIFDRVRKLHGETETDHIFVCILKPSSVIHEIRFMITTGIHVDEDKAVSWDLVENPENHGLPLLACKPPIPCLEKVKIEQNLGSENEELCCAICLQDFSEGSEAAATKCSHLYHCHCIVKWLSRSSSCPMCRSKLPRG